MSIDGAVVADALVATLRTLDLGAEGVVSRLVEKPAPGVHRAVDRVEVRKGVGFAGDHQRKSYWKGKLIPGREVTALSAEVAAILGFEPTAVGDNIVFVGLDLTAMGAGTELRLGDEVVLIRSAEKHRPCALFRERTSDAAYQIALDHNHRGALFVVKKGGTLKRGDRAVVAGP